MGFAKRVIEALLIMGAAALFLPPSAFTQERVGVVTNVEGTVTVARLTLNQTQPLGSRTTCSSTTGSRPASARLSESCSAARPRSPRASAHPDDHRGTGSRDRPAR